MKLEGDRGDSISIYIYLVNLIQFSKSPKGASPGHRPPHALPEWINSTFLELPSMRIC